MSDLSQSISQKIAHHTAAVSNFDKTRDYISLSHIHKEAEEIIGYYKNGFPDDFTTRLRCYKGYQMEKDLLQRVKAVYGDRVKTSIEVSAYGGLVKGHPDFTFDGFPGDCKSMLMDEWLPQGSKVPRRIYWQMQAYMKYMGKPKALLIFESRQSGQLTDCWIRANEKIQSDIENKLKIIVNAIVHLTPSS